MKPCWASWRRWYDVAPVLRPSRWARAVAVVGPSVRRMPRIRSRTGWVSARSCCGVGVIERVSTIANIPLQRTVCKVSFGNQAIVRDVPAPRTVFPQVVSSRTIPRVPCQGVRVTLELRVVVDDLSGPEVAALLTDHLDAMRAHSPACSVHAL